MKLIDYFGSLNRSSAVPILGYPGLTTEGITVEQCLREPKLHAKVVRSNFEHFHPDAALPLLDLTIEAEYYGPRAEYNDLDPPQLNSSLTLESWEDKTLHESRIPLMVETARLIEAQISEVPVGFYVTGPFTLAGQIVGVQSLLMGMFKNPSGLLELLKSCTGTVVDYANQLKEAEIDFLVIADPTSSLISKRQFDDFSKPALARVVNAFSNDSVLHICGRSGHLLKQMVDTGAKGLSLDDNVKLTDATASVPKDVVIMGNYSPTKLAYESPETIRTEVRRMLDPLNGNGNVVASTGCDISASTPPANIHAFMRAVKTYARNSMTSQDSHVTCLGNR